VSLLGKFRIRGTMYEETAMNTMTATAILAIGGLLSFGAADAKEQTYRALPKRPPVHRSVDYQALQGSEYSETQHGVIGGVNEFDVRDAVRFPPP
jgi:hypothetical protein